MVAAGIFLLAKIYLLIPSGASNIIAVVGALTSLMAALSALFQFDIKKILAYSTISQLGFMVMAIGVRADAAAMTHLFTHAFFKAGLFLGAGAIIHSLHQLEQQTHHHFDVQDIRNLGGLKKHLPVTFFTFIICSAALAGLPFFSGFLSKDAILTGVWFWKSDVASWGWGIVFVAVSIPFLTVMYTFRLVWFVFFGEIGIKESIRESFIITEVPAVMRLPLIILASCSLWLIVSINPFNYSGWLFSSLDDRSTFHVNLITILSALWVITALVVSFFYYRSRTLSTKSNNIQTLIRQAFHVDSVFKNSGLAMKRLSVLTSKTDTKLIDGAIHFTAYAQVTLSHVTGWFDKYFIDGMVDGMARIVGALGSFVRSFQGGKIQLYIFWAIFGIIIFLIWMLI
jgi:NADH-quinone oxidoreductase subunit L